MLSDVEKHKRRIFAEINRMVGYARDVYKARDLIMRDDCPVKCGTCHPWWDCRIRRKGAPSVPIRLYWHIDRMKYEMRVVEIDPFLTYCMRTRLPADYALYRFAWQMRHNYTTIALWLLSKDVKKNGTIKIEAPEEIRNRGIPSYGAVSVFGDHPIEIMDTMHETLDLLCEKYVIAVTNPTLLTEYVKETYGRKNDDVRTETHVAEPADRDHERLERRAGDDTAGRA